MDFIDKKALEAQLTRDLCVLMEGESAKAFRGKAWNGQKWPARKRDDGIGSLLIRQSKLWRGLRFQLRGNRVQLESDMPYARIHNEGGTIKVPLTPKMRKFFWAAFYKTKDPRWKAMALTSKQTLTVKIPKRQYAGITPRTEQLWQEAVDKRFRALNITAAVRAKIRTQ